MSNAGYGNHDEPPPTKATAEHGSAAAKPPTAKTPPEPADTHVSTPGDGAGPDAPVGKDVDPGVG